ncbi:tensin-1 isoform X8 [Anopheles stephensi]|uniref:tensin-1 isoform X8 n=1 Tax=Anopheles stephensi TaxID=30069 RepID=UPI001658B04F|nr:tensin-1 isoform X8 [Anopheles stephensi]
MPWGCLCSKEKKRPQISSPILNPEDTQKLQLLPAVRLPLLSDAEKLEQRLLAPHPNADFDNESSEETQPPNDAGRDRLQQQLLQKSRLKSSNLKSTTYTRNTENDKLTRHLNTVKFSFDEPVPQKPDGAGKPLRKSSERSEPPPKPDRRITSTATQQIVVKLPDTAGNVSLEHPAADEIDCNGNGNYDIVPTIKISDNGVHGAELEGRTENKAQVDENKNEILVPGSSEGSIPFIDEDPTQILRQLNANPQRGQNFHDARIITLTPKNVGSEATRTAAAAAAATAAAATAAASEQVHREAQLRLLADTKKFTRFLVEPPPVVTVETVKFTHIFQILPPAYDRLCQQCHKALHLDIGLRCVVCDFTCHQQCVRLEKKNGREEEQQQQAINKYNSLPLHAINAQQQQQQQQPRPATNLNHVNNNHYHNYSLQPYYNRQPQQHQQSPHQHHSYPVARIAEEPSYQSLRLNYVTERILASTLPARRLQNGSSSPHASNGSLPADEHERELISMLEQKHKQNYRILDLESRLVNITLEKLCELCKYIDSWLGSGKEKIVVLQDREDKHRLGTAIAAYLQYQKICGSNIPQAGGHSKSSLSPGGSTDNGRKTPTWLDLDIFSMQKFLESFANPLRIPSHKRYIQYFSGLLSGVIKLNSSSFFLKAIRVESPPCLHYRAITVNSEWRSFIKIFEGVRCLFTSDIYVIPITTRHFIYEIKHPLRLRGDILVRCYQIIPNNNKATYEKELIASVQFHTCAITEKEVQFKKGDLDWACDDERFSAEHTMTFCFDTVPNERPMILVFQDPLVRIEPIAENGDHLETINEGWTKQDESGHTQGPLDGSLYATILKSPKSPTAPHLISPPAEFSNGKSLLLNGTGPPPVPERSKTPNSIYLSHNGTPRSTPVPFAVAPPPPASPALGNGDVKYALNESKSSATSVRTVSSSYGSYQSPGAPDGSGSPGVTLASSGKTRPSATQVDGRESVRSPLTVSMDSGISSSGPVNRRIQGSSVSPSSFPSPQASPQDDRHRELDDLLSDMMLTVQGIPDVGQKADQTNHHQSQQQQQQQHHHHHHHQQQHQNPNDHFVNTNTDTIKRSHSAQLPPVTTREDNRSRTPLTVSDYSPSAAAAAAAAAAAKERELLMYETSSTTTTLTPPPSESGRETPLLSAYASGGGTIRERDLQNINNNNLTPAERELIMSVQRHQHQSLAYPRPARSTTGASERFTSDDDDDLLGGGSSGGQIPYHAREDSRPFTYGNIPASGTPQHPPAATMIKMQSGLSSPSMVRKALGTPTAGRKTATLPRNDFEEMLRERREKVLSEKYTIGDQSPGGGTGGIMVSDTINNNNSSAGDGRWTYQQHHTVKTVTTQGAGTTPNGYPAHEPLKRSNTMDGSFGRQFSNEGISGQSWLQLQQQKLRARREQQRREHSNSFSYNYGSPAFPTGENVYSTTHRRSQTLSPVRNDRNYHTLTTTRTHSTERPFVAVQRAHENAKLQTIGNAPLSILNASPHGHIAQAQTQASSPSPSSTHTTVSSPSPAPPSTGNSVSITHHHHHHHQQTVNGSSSAAGSPVNGQQHPATPQQHRHINGNDAHYQSQQQQLNSSLNGSSGLLSLADQDHSTPKHGQVRLAREESFSSYRSETEPDNSPMGGSPRPETPAFPVTPRTPYGLSNGTSSPALPPKSPTSQRKNVLYKHLEKLALAKASLFQCVAPVLEKRTQGCTFYYNKDLFSGGNQRTQELINQNETLSCYTSRRNSTTSNANSEPQEVAPQFVKFARDSSKYWYKPNISREEAIALLRNAAPGTFIVRDSTTFANAYGLVVKVNHPPPGVQYTGPNSEELVRHFLVEPTIRGVRLKGCANEPVFTSLSALVYQHSITPLALPCRLIIPDMDLQQMEHQTPAQQQLLQQGAACNVLYLFTCDTESLTGPQAIRKAVSSLLALRPLPKPTQVHFKASLQGITLTDNTRQLFFRRHYPSNNVSFCALDPDDRRWSIQSTTGDIPATKRMFAFVAKRSPSSADNQCHVFCELEPTQPAAAIIQFANKVLTGTSQQPAVTRAI